MGRIWPGGCSLRTPGLKAQSRFLSSADYGKLAEHGSTETLIVYSLLLSKESQRIKRGVTYLCCRSLTTGVISTPSKERFNVLREHHLLHLQLQIVIGGVPIGLWFR